MTRDDLRVIIRTGLEQTRGSYRVLLELFHMEAGDYERFLGFLRQHDCHLSYQSFRALNTGPRAGNFVTDDQRVTGPFQVRSEDNPSLESPQAEMTTVISVDSGKVETVPTAVSSPSSGPIVSPTHTPEARAAQQQHDEALITSGDDPPIELGKRRNRFLDEGHSLADPDEPELPAQVSSPPDKASEDSGLQFVWVCPQCERRGGCPSSC